VCVCVCLCVCVCVYALKFHGKNDTQTFINTHHWFLQIEIKFYLLSGLRSLFHQEDSCGKLITQFMKMYLYECKIVIHTVFLSVVLFGWKLWSLILKE
jgi:hypothetical protein